MCGDSAILRSCKREKESLDIPSLTDTYRKMNLACVLLRQEITSLVPEQKEENYKCSWQEEEMAKMLKMLKFLKEVVKIVTSQ